MNLARLLGRSLWYYWRTNLGVAAGSAVAAAVLIGALVVGDSVRLTLQEQALARLGRVDLALVAPGRYFRSALADAVADELGAPVAPVLRLRGVAASDAARANAVQVLGVDERFWALSPGGRPPVDDLAEAVVLNERLARQLRVGPGAMVLLRLSKPELLSLDAPLSRGGADTVAFRLRVAAIASEAAFGRFGLQASQIPPQTAFVPLGYLQRRAGLPGRANLLLAGGLHGRGPLAANAALRRRWRLADAALEVRRLAGRGVLELRSGRVFLEAPVVRAAAKALPEAVGVLTYFVNELRAGKRAAPYSMVAAVGVLAGPVAGTSRPRPTGPTGLADLLPAGMKDDEIVVNRWLAEDLKLEVGDEVRLSYYVLGPMRRLERRGNRFRVRAVVPLAGPWADPTLMPEFPGLAGVDSCRDWKPGVPIDLDRVRPQDEQYWEDYRGTPKAFVTLAAGRRMWANRFGELTAVRWPAGGMSAPALAERLRRRLDPAELGLAFQDLRGPALRASGEALDFGGLFIGLSFFLMAAAVLLMALLFVLGVEQRGVQIGLLRAVGWPARKVRRLLMAEGALLAAVGVVLGVPMGLLYTRAMLAALGTVWRGAVAGAAIGFHVEPATVVEGAVGAMLVAAAAMWLALRRAGRAQPRELLAGAGLEATLISPTVRARWLWWVGLGLCLVGVGAVLGCWAAGLLAEPAAFFINGSLVLIGWLTGWRLVLVRLGRPGRRRAVPRLTVLGCRNAARRPGRSLAVVALLACGSFLVIAVGANRRDPLAGADMPSSGTGGFELLANSAMPILHDLNGPAGRAELGLSAEAMRGVRVVQLRVKEGDDASCLNLNRAQRPRLLGVRPELLHERGAFTFVKAAEGLAVERGWLLLNARQDDGAVPAIADQATVTWALDKGVGQTVEYLDERGRPFRVRIVATLADSILQGSLLISERAFIRHFPSHSGYQMLLVDTPPGRADEVARALSRAGRDVGLEVAAAVERLAELTGVQNTYLSIFQVLGGLGMVLGSVGLGVVVMRNVLERRAELALLQVVGFRRGWLHRLVLAEHWRLLVLGLAGGLVAAVVAVLPALRSPGSEVPYLSLALTLAAVGGSGLLWTVLATAAAIRGPLLPALRSE